MPSPVEASTRALHEALALARSRIASRDDALLATQVAVSEIAAPTGDEGARARWMASRLAAVGLHDVRIDDAGNVVARRAGITDEPPVLVCAHLDTVFPAGTALTVRRDGDRLTGPGIGDNGRGLAVLLALAEELDGTAVRTRRPIVFAATTGEEGAGDLRGAKRLFASLPRGASAAIALDGAGDDRIVHRALGSRRFHVRFTGAGGHSWAAWGTPNPVHAAGFAVAALGRFAVPSTPRTTLSVSRIGGGIAVNAIPGDAWFEVDVRSTAGPVLDRCEGELRTVVRAAVHEENARRATGTAPLGASVRVIGDRPCGETPADHPLVQAAIAATRLIEREPELALASTDANVPISLGIPGIAIGAGGRGGDAHTPLEWYENADGQAGVARALTILVAAAGLA
jgi:tripeptide aminopeptidase